MSKGVFVRLSDDAYEALKRKAEEKNLSVYKLVKRLIEDYSLGKIKILSIRDAVLLEKNIEINQLKRDIQSMKDEFTRTKNKIDEWNERISLIDFLVEQVITIDQRLSALEKRLTNLEKEMNVG